MVSESLSRSLLIINRQKIKNKDMNKSKFLTLGGLATVLTLFALGVSAQAPLTETTQTQIQNFGDRMELRLTAALQRADNLRTRVADRVNRFPNPKFDQTLVAQKLKEAAEAVAAGQTKVAAIDAEVAKALAAANKITAFANLRQATREIIASVRVAHQKVVEAIRIIKPATTPASQ